MARIARFNWNHDHVRTLNNLYDRHRSTFDRGRKLARRNAAGRNVRLSERQYIILRFRRQYGLAAYDVSDQAIWAKYQRVNGQLAAKAAQVNRKRVASKFSAGTVTVTPGMKMNDWTDLGIACLGAGATRKVYDLGEYVLKVARNRRDRFDGTQSNRREARTWKNISAADEKYFAAILAADPDGNWVVQEKVSPRHNGRTAAASRVAKKYRVSDLHHGNFGTRADGTVVVLDYASA